MSIEAEAEELQIKWMSERRSHGFDDIYKAGQLAMLEKCKKLIRRVYDSSLDDPEYLIEELTKLKGE